MSPAKYDCEGFGDAASRRDRLLTRSRPSRSCRTPARGEVVAPRRRCNEKTPMSQTEYTVHYQPLFGVLETVDVQALIDATSDPW
jgi:hypothetical protein